MFSIGDKINRENEEGGGVNTRVEHLMELIATSARAEMTVPNQVLELHR